MDHDVPGSYADMGDQFRTLQIRKASILQTSIQKAKGAKFPESSVQRDHMVEMKMQWIAKWIVKYDLSRGIRPQRGTI